MQGSNDAPTNDTPEEGTEDEDEDMPELMPNGKPHCLCCDPRFYNADEVMLVSSLRGNRSTQESMARVELRNTIRESRFGLCALLTGSNPTPGIASSSSSTSETASASASAMHAIY